jgi:hypothetical protein
MGMTQDMVTVIRAMNDNVPTADYPLAFVQQINLLDPK